MIRKKSKMKLITNPLKTKRGEIRPERRVQVMEELDPERILSVLAALKS